MQQNEAPQQKAPLVRVCWDDLFDFMKGWFAKTAPVLEKPILEINRYSGVLAAWQKVVEWKVTDGSRGELKEISVICDDYTNLKVRIVVAGLERKEKQLQTALTLPFKDLKLISGQVVVAYCKSDGATAIVFDACIVGKEIIKL